MGAYDEDAPRLSEIVRMLHSMDRKFDDFRNQVNIQLQDKVSKERYEPERDLMRASVIQTETALRGEIARVNGVVEALKSRSQTLTTAFYGGMFSLVVGLILIYVNTK